MASNDSDFALERGISQVLHSYAPEDVVNFGQLGVVVKVKEWTNGGRMDDVDKDRIADVVRGRASRFRNRTSATNWDEVGPDDIDVFQPGKAKAAMFPLVFYCEDCGKVETATQPQYLPNGGTCRASDCDGNLTQLPFVNVHECGNIEGPGPNRGCNNDDCDSEGFDDYRLVKTSGAPATWYYKCRMCGERMGKLAASCSRCDDGMSGPLPASSNRVQYTQSAVVIDIPLLDEDPSDVPSGEPWARTLMAVYLGESELGDHTLESLAATAGSAEQYQQLVDKWDKKMVDDVIETMDVPVRGREVAAEQTRHVVPPEVSGVIDGRPEVAYSQIGRQLFTFLRSTEGYEGDANDLGDTRHPIPDSLSDYLSDGEFVKRHPQSKRYPKQLAKTHMRDAWVVDQFPLLNLSFGYTRDSPTPRKTDVHEFPHPTSLNTTPVFADRTPSEAIVFEIDRAAIVNWLLANDVISASEAPDVTDEGELKAWFLNNVQTTELENPLTEIDDPVTENVYRLLHTLSHCLLATAGEQCGLATNSLSERILPVVPAITIYAASTENFALGAMFTMFKTRLYPWVRDGRLLAEQCLLDPACSDDPEGAACDACVHIGMTSCEAMNHHLDRRLLAGDDGVVGFLDEDVESNIQNPDPEIPLTEDE